MVELRNGPPAMFYEVLQRLTSRLNKQDTNYQVSLETGLKVEITLRHLASVNTYRIMQYARRVPHNTINKVVKEVVKAIIKKYTDEFLCCPTTEQGWSGLADQ